MFIFSYKYVAQKSTMLTRNHCQKKVYLKENVDTQCVYTD